MPIPDNPEFRGRLLSVFMSAYVGRTSFERLLLIRLNKRLNLGAGGMNDIVFEVLFNVAEPEGWLEDLIGAARTDRPNVEALEELACQIGLPARAAVGLRDVADLAHSRDTFRRALLRYRDGFQNAQLRMKEVVALKQVHDWLHDVQNLLFVPLSVLESGFPTAQGLRTLRGLKDWLDRRKESLTTVLASARADSGLEFPWPKQMGDVSAFLETAYAQSSRADLSLAVEELRTILDVNLGGIDFQLRTTVQQLNLKELVAQLLTVHESVTQQGATQEDLNRLSASIEALDSLHLELQRLKDNHQTWQNIDNRRKAVGHAIRVGRPPGAVWVLLVNAVRDIQGNEGISMHQLMAAVDELNEPIKGADDDLIKELYSRVDGLISEQFLAADRRLMDLTGQLQSTASALLLILGNLQ